jgi:toxin ParE1/3/4
MTPAVIRTLPARRDLAEIWDYIAARNPDAADRVLDRIEVECRHLAEMPGMGRRRDELEPGIRSWRVGRWRYLIFYREIRDGIEVV